MGKYGTFGTVWALTTTVDPNVNPLQVFSVTVSITETESPGINFLLLASKFVLPIPTMDVTISNGAMPGLVTV